MKWEFHRQLLKVGQADLGAGRGISFVAPNR
jgi:hypothetical protein